MNIFGVFWIVVSPKPDPLPSVLRCFTHSVSSQLSLSLNIVSDLERDIFSEGSTSEVLRPVYVPTFHLHTVYLGKQRQEFCTFLLLLPYLFIYFTRDFNLRYYPTLSVTCPGFMLVVIMTYFYLFKECAVDAEAEDASHGLIWTEKL